jgi:hypothetical protein
MSESCFSFEELAEIATSPAADPRRAHLDACPRCQARLLDMGDFERPLDSQEEERMAPERLRLAEALRREMAGEAGPAVSAVGSEPVLVRLRRLLTGPALRPALALVGVVAIGALLYGTLRPGARSGRGDLLRSPSGPSAATVAGLRATALPQGRFELAWAPLAQAEAYEVRIFRDDLTELARLGPFGEPRASFGTDSLATRPAPGTVLVWQVVALRSGDPVAESALETLELR